MAQPVILAVDDEPEILNAIERDLRAHYSATCRVMKAASGAQALDTVHEIKKRGTPVALFLANQRMPDMTGTQFLSQAIALYADARRVLLTADADTDAAIVAINEINLGHYLLKPWEPPTERQERCARQSTKYQTDHRTSTRGRARLGPLDRRIKLKTDRAPVGPSHIHTDARHHGPIRLALTNQRAGQHLYEEIRPRGRTQQQAGAGEDAPVVVPVAPRPAALQHSRKRPEVPGKHNTATGVCRGILPKRDMGAEAELPRVSGSLGTCR